jgi:hypothetical protein
MSMKKSKKETEDAIAKIKQSDKPQEKKLLSANQMNLRPYHYLLKADVNC